MESAVHDLDSDILGINLAGRMDLNGTREIDLKFTALTATRRARILVDLSNVTFIASIGIRTLISNAADQLMRRSQSVTESRFQERTSGPGRMMGLTPRMRTITATSLIS